MYIIDRKIIETAPPCPEGRVCLTGDRSHCCTCSVKQDEGDYLIIEHPENVKSPLCPYSKKVKGKESNFYVCSCPVRMEIFRKYGH